MTIQVRPITRRESEILDRWQRLDDIVLYRLARILRLSEAKWKCLVIARALVLHVETVRQVINAFNKGGIPAITPNPPRSGGRPPRHIQEVAEAAERLVRQEGYSAIEGRATWRLVKAIVVRLNHIDAISHEAVRRLLARWNIVYRQAIGTLLAYNDGPAIGICRSWRGLGRAGKRHLSLTRIFRAVGQHRTLQGRW